MKKREVGGVSMTPRRLGRTKRIHQGDRGLWDESTLTGEIGGEKRGINNYSNRKGCPTNGTSKRNPQGTPRLKDFFRRGEWVVRGLEV